MFGEHLRTQVEDRLTFYATGDIPKKNAEVMKEALESHNAQVGVNLKDTNEAVYGQFTPSYVRNLSTILKNSLDFWYTKIWYHCKCWIWIMYL